jgi:hypothetical protein
MPTGMNISSFTTARYTMLLSIPPGIEFGTIRKTEGHHSGRGAGNLFSQPLSRRRPGGHVSSYKDFAIAGLFSFMVYAEKSEPGG